MQPRPRKLTGRIISFGAPTAVAEGLIGDGEEIPFRPAFDLLEAQEKLPSPQDIAAIGVALATLLSLPHSTSRSTWANGGLFDGVNREHSR